ncbi:MAG: ABC transporter ATP-binding protein [Deferrisomatales bacterium]
MSMVAVLKRVGRYFVPHWRNIAVSMGCMLIVAGSVGATAWLVKPVLDDVFIRKDERMLVLLPLGVMLLYLVKGVARYTQSFFMRSVSESVVLKIRNDLFGNLILRDVGFFEKTTTGDLMVLVTNDVLNMQRSIPDVINLIRQVFTSIGLAIVLFQRDWLLASISVLVFPIIAFPLRRIHYFVRKYVEKGQVSIGFLSNIINEAFSGIRVIKVFGAESREMQRFHAGADKLRGFGLKIAKVTELAAPLMEFVGAVGAGAIIWYGGYQVIHGVSTPGEFFSFLTALFMLYDPLKRGGSASISLQMALISAERVLRQMDAPVAPCEGGGSATLERPVRAVELVDVVFSYRGEGQEVLRGVSLRAVEGEAVALVGPSGGGKSTILKLLPRFYDVTGGSVRINGRDIREYSVESLRSAMAVVTQDTFLFNDTVRSNLLVGRAGATEEEVVAAAKAAYAHEFITALPQGYDTPIGERGDLLSGGQKQRLAIARAILRDAPILILDEATSALDSESEQAVQLALAALVKGRTTFVIAHRLSTVRHAQQILYIRDGQVVEQGTHDELLRREGEYARLCELQFGRTENGGAGEVFAPAAP